MIIKMEEKKRKKRSERYKIIVIEKLVVQRKKRGGKMFIGEERVTNTFIRRDIRGRRCSLEGNRYTIP